MLKIMGRIFLILLAAGLVSAGLYLAVNSQAGQSWLASGAIEGDFARIPGANGQDGLPNPGNAASLAGQAPQGAGFQPGFGERDFHDRVSPTAGLFGIARDISVIALITIGVVLMQKAVRWLARKPALQEGGDY